MLPKERLNQLNEAVDKDGNSFKVDVVDDDNFIRFYKKGNPDILTLGKLIIGERGLLYYKFEDERNIFLKTDSWSINYSIFQYVDYIVYETRTKWYQISKERAVEFGDVLQFDGTEEKIYIPLRFWDIRRTLIDPTEKRRRNLIGDSWYEKLGGVLGSPYMTEIANFLNERRKVAVVYPEQQNIFRAYKLSTFEHTKVVILGQDPYHDGSADGLAFSYLNGSKKPVQKSLDLIIKEIERDVYDGFNLDFDYNLGYMARQGVLLLNAALTVEHGKPQSHSHIGWDRFVKITLYELLKDLRPRVFMFWGNIAQTLYGVVQEKMREQNVAAGNHLILYAKHPASDLYGKDSFGNVTPNYPQTFSGCKHFSQANAFLKINKRKEIIW